jgi:hypothetical protein
MEGSDQLHAPASLPPAKEPLGLRAAKVVEKTKILSMPGKAQWIHI